MSNRRRAESRFNRLYKLVCKDPICVYCGVPSTTIDHFVPISVVAMLAEVMDVVHGRVLLPSCGECNLLAGANLFKTVAAKRRFIHKKLAKRYKRVLAIPSWSPVELAELDYALRDLVTKGLVQQTWLRARLGWRNTSNREAVRLAEIRSPLGADGRSFAVRHTARTGTGKSGRRL